MRPIRPIGIVGKKPRAPWPRSTSFETAPWVTRDSSRWAPWGAIGAHGGRPMGHMGPMGHHTGPSSPTQLLRLPRCDPSQGTHAAHRAPRKGPADTIATMDLIRKGAMGHLGRIQMGPMACYKPIRGSPDGPHGSHGPPHCPQSPTQLLHLSSLAPSDPSQGTHAAHLAHRKEPTDTMANMDLI